MTDKTVNRSYTITAVDPATGYKVSMAFTDSMIEDVEGSHAEDVLRMVFDQVNLEMDASLDTLAKDQENVMNILNNGGKA